MLRPLSSRSIQSGRDIGTSTQTAKEHQRWKTDHHTHSSLDHIAVVLDRVDVMLAEDASSSNRSTLRVLLIGVAVGFLIAFLCFDASIFDADAMSLTKYVGRLRTSRMDVRTGEPERAYASATSRRRAHEHATVTDDHSQQTPPICEPPSTPPVTHAGKVEPVHVESDPLRMSDLLMNFEYPSTLLQHPVTVVTAYFTSPSAKHSLEEYRLWLSNFISYNSQPMVIATSRDFFPVIANMRYKKCLDEAGIPEPQWDGNKGNDYVKEVSSMLTNGRARAHEYVEFPCAHFQFRVVGRCLSRCRRRAFRLIGYSNFKTPSKCRSMCRIMRSYKRCNRGIRRENTSHTRHSCMPRGPRQCNARATSASGER
jgi:hypothetical protein